MRNGIDGITIPEFESRLEEELGQLQKELQSWIYKPEAVRRVEIPKPGKGARWFMDYQGQKIRSDETHLHWMNLNQWVNVT